MAVPHEVIFQNQLQFNLNVPLTTYNMATHFHQPRPITIEKATVPLAGQGFPMAQLANRPSEDNKIANGFNFSVLSQEKMALAVQMAQRDRKNQQLQQRNNQLTQSKYGYRSSSSDSQHHHQTQKPIHGTRMWECRRSRTRRKSPHAKSARLNKMNVREHDRNIAPCSTASQTPPSSPPRQAFLNTRVIPAKERSDSPPTRDTPSLTRVARDPADDIEKLQLEMELCLQQIESVQKRALHEQNTEFLRCGSSPSSKETQQLQEEEREERRQLRNIEQSHRALRTIYNLHQQVKELERQVPKLPRNHRATKKSQASLRLLMVNKGALKLLKMFVSQLPQQDFHSGLPHHFSELAELVRQVTLLSAGSPLDGGKAKEVKKSSLSSVETDLIAMVDQVEKLNEEWQRELSNQEEGPQPGKQKPPFVTKFGINNSAFVKEKIPRAQLPTAHGHNAWFEERKALLKAGIQTLLDAGRKKKPNKAIGGHPYQSQLAPPIQPRPKGRVLKHPSHKPQSVTRKGFLRSHKGRSQRHPTTFQSPTHFADPTITANLKASTLLHNPITSRQPRKNVNFAKESGKRTHFMASYPGASARRSVPSSHHQSQQDIPSYYYSDSDSYFLSDEESSPSFLSNLDAPRPVSSTSRSLSPVGRSHRSGPSYRISRPVHVEQRKFYVADADPEVVEELIPEEKGAHQNVASSKKNCDKHLRKGEVTLTPFLQEMERRVRERLAPILKNHQMVKETRLGEEDLNQIVDAIMDKTVEEVTSEYLAKEDEEAGEEIAAAYIDVPSLENILQALDRMEKENEQLRKKYTTINFHDSAPTRRVQAASEVIMKDRSEQPCEPPAFEVINMRSEQQDSLAFPRVFTSEIPKEPLIFTKDSKRCHHHVQFQEQGEDLKAKPDAVLIAPLCQTSSVIRPKKLLSMKQTVVERITDSVERFDYYQRGLKHHLGKKNPCQYYESVTDSIVKMCLEEVAGELEHINADMAENIYTSEFMDEKGLPLAPATLADDFETSGTAARNLRDSAAAHQSVRAAVSDTVTDLLLPLEKSDLPTKYSDDTVESASDVSSPRDTSLKHVYDATALYEANVIETPAEASQVTLGKSVTKEEGTHEDVDEDDEYEDDYTDFTDEEDESESPSP